MHRKVDIHGRVLDPVKKCYKNYSTFYLMENEFLYVLIQKSNLCDILFCFKQNGNFNRRQTAPTPVRGIFMDRRAGCYVSQTSEPFQGFRFILSIIFSLHKQRTIIYFSYCKYLNKYIWKKRTRYTLIDCSQLHKAGKHRMSWLGKHWSPGKLPYCVYNIQSVGPSQRFTEQWHLLSSIFVLSGFIKSDLGGMLTQSLYPGTRQI